MRCLPISVALVTICAVIASAAEKQEIPPKIKAYLTRQPTPAEKVAALREAQQKLSEARQALSRGQRGKVNRTQTKTTVGPRGTITFPSNAAKRAGIKEAREQFAKATSRLRGLKNGTAPWLAKMQGARPTVGAIGRLPTSQANIRQIIDGQNMLAEVAWSLGYSFPAGKRMVRIKDHMVPFWVKGRPTKGLTDKTGTKLGEVFEITGTETYQTVDGGTKTVLVIEPLDLTPYLPSPKSIRAK